MPFRRHEPSWLRPRHGQHRPLPPAVLLDRHALPDAVGWGWTGARQGPPRLQHQQLLTARARAASVRCPLIELPLSRQWQATSPAPRCMPLSVRFTMKK
eukprot:14807826-Alexandrium_andersonii.AAC.1